MSRRVISTRSFSANCAAFNTESRAMIAKRNQIITPSKVFPLLFSPRPRLYVPVYSPALQISTFQLDVLRTALKISPVKTGLCLSSHVSRNYAVLARVQCVNGMSKFEYLEGGEDLLSRNCAKLIARASQAALLDRPDSKAPDYERSIDCSCTSRDQEKRGWGCHKESYRGINTRSNERVDSKQSSL